MKQMAVRAFLGVLSSLECRGYRMAKYLHRKGRGIQLQSWEGHGELLQEQVGERVKVVIDLSFPGQLIPQLIPWCFYRSRWDEDDPLPPTLSITLSAPSNACGEDGDGPLLSVSLIQQNLT